MRNTFVCFVLAACVAAVAASTARAADACCGGKHGGLCGCLCCDGAEPTAKCLAQHPECVDDAGKTPGANDETLPPIENLVHFRFNGETKRVIDGGNLVVWKDNKQVKVRLAGIACPSRGQPFADAARKFTAAAVGKKKAVDVEVTGVDKTGRLLAQVTTPDGKNLNRELIKAGLAWSDNRNAPTDRELETLQAEARATGVGLWADPDPVPPWQWKKPKKQ